MVQPRWFGSQIHVFLHSHWSFPLLTFHLSTCTNELCCRLHWNYSSAQWDASLGYELAPLPSWCFSDLAISDQLPWPVCSNRCVALLKLNKVQKGFADAEHCMTLEARLGEGLLQEGNCVWSVGEISRGESQCEQSSHHHSKQLVVISFQFCFCFVWFFGLVAANL